MERNVIRDLSQSERIKTQFKVTKVPTDSSRLKYPVGIHPIHLTRHVTDRTESESFLIYKKIFLCGVVTRLILYTKDKIVGTRSKR